MDSTETPKEDLTVEVKNGTGGSVPEDPATDLLLQESMKSEGQPQESDMMETVTAVYTEDCEVATSSGIDERNEFPEVTEDIQVVVAKPLEPEPSSPLSNDPQTSGDGITGGVENETTADDGNSQMDVVSEVEGGVDDVRAQIEEMENIPEEPTETVSSSYYWNFEIPFESTSTPKCLISTNNDEFGKTGCNKKCARYVKGCKWAPDGSCLLSNSDDDNLRVFNFPSICSQIEDWSSSDTAVVQTEDWSSVLKVKEGGQVYDYCWYPLMSSMDPVSSCFLTSSSQAPIHLWDAFTGKLRASYQPFDHLEQLVSAYSLAFDATGETIYAGFEKSIRLFNITRPGKVCVERPLKQSIAELSQYGIVASIAVNPSLRTIYAVGSFGKTVGLYCEDGSVVCLLQGHLGGITHMKFSSDGLKLVTGGRKDSRLICWDMRKMGEAFQIYDREIATHQRIYFDVTPNDRYLISGGTDGFVKIWDMKSEDSQPLTFRSNGDCVNGISVNPYVPLLATSSGQRHFLEIADDSDDELFVKPVSILERSCDIKLWKLT